MNLIRKSNWDSELYNWFERNRRRPFEWGYFDCALMAADCIKAITGTDVVPDLWGTYYTPLGAYRIQKKYGGLSGLCDEILGQRTNPKTTRRGDILLLMVGDRETLCVNFGSEVLIMTKNRPQLIDKRSVDIISAWRVG